MKEEEKKEAFENLGIIFTILAIELLGFVVWAHQIFTVGIDVDKRAYFTSATIIIAVHTRIKIFRWLTTVYGSRLTYRATCLWSLGFVFLFTIGGLTWVVLANSSIAIILHDIYYTILYINLFYNFREHIFSSTCTYFCIFIFFVYSVYFWLR
jgi:heme/copper-type cytochrome/quinol oxidase subunit 1